MSYILILNVAQAISSHRCRGFCVVVNMVSIAIDKIIHESCSCVMHFEAPLSRILALGEKLDSEFS